MISRIFFIFILISFNQDNLGSCQAVNEINYYTIGFSINLQTTKTNAKELYGLNQLVMQEKMYLLHSQFENITNRINTISNQQGYSKLQFNNQTLKSNSNFLIHKYILVTNTCGNNIAKTTYKDIYYNKISKSSISQVFAQQDVSVISKSLNSISFISFNS